MIVGTDGARSQVRQQIFGKEQGLPKDLGLGYLNLSFSYHDAEKALFVRKNNPVNSFVVHPDCAVLIAVQEVQDPDKPADWRFQIAMNWASSIENDLSNAEKHRKVKELAKNICEPYHSAIQWIPEDVEIHFSPLSFWEPKPFDTQDGRITLAGDAAHAMPPNRGQGCNHAINDAMDFVNAVKAVTAGDEQARTIQAYNDEVVQRGAKETLLSKESAAKTVEYANSKDHGMMKYGLARSPEQERASR